MSVWLLLRPTRCTSPPRAAAGSSDGVAARPGRAGPAAKPSRRARRRAAGRALAAVTPARPGFRAGLAAGWAVIRASPTAQLALAAIVVSHLVMVGLMSMTPSTWGTVGRPCRSSGSSSVRTSRACTCSAP
ncbi:hypothetical protein NKG05_08190 [Oerskovia sp. M15]